MPGYVIADVTVTDEETYAGYRALTPATIDAFGGRFLVRVCLRGDRGRVGAGPAGPDRVRQRGPRRRVVRLARLHQGAGDPAARVDRKPDPRRRRGARGRRCLSDRPLRRARRCR